MAILTFHGGAQQVTGSCYLLETPALGKVLLDCGMHQGGDAVERLQKERFAFDPRSIDRVILSHAHLDHSGLLPALVAGGFDGTIHCTRATKLLLRVMLEDAAGLYERDLQYENLRRQRRGEDPLEPVYTDKHVKRALQLCRGQSYHEEHDLGQGCRLRFHDAGHILGSGIVELTVREREEDKVLVFSGDLGKYGSALMNNPEKLERADLVLMEGTYGNRNHRGLDDTVTQLEQVLHETWERKGNVMIPAFAVGRTQELLYHLGALQVAGRLDPWQIFVDSPMAIEVTRIYQDCMHLLDGQDLEKLGSDFVRSMQDVLPRLRFSQTVEESMAINKVGHGAIILAGSGMCTGGRIRHHFKQRIWNQRNTVLFAGFQARGTLGRALVDGAKTVHMFREEYAVRARIETLGGFSAHAGQDELIDWVRHFRDQPRLMLVHGEPDALEVLSMKLWKEYDISSEIPFIGQKIHF